MKHICITLLIGLHCFSCNSKQKPGEPLVFTMDEDFIETAMAIIWIDKYDIKNHDAQKVRTSTNNSYL